MHDGSSPALQEWTQPCRIAGLTFTDLCNQRCKHCHNDSRVRVAKPQLTLAEWTRVAGELRQIGVEFISFGGGESLVHSDFLDFARMLREHGFRLGVITNGTSDPETIPWNLFETIAVSIEFPDPKDQDAFRGYRGAYAEALRTLEYLRDQPVERELFTALMGINHHSLPRMYELAESLEVDYWKVIRFRTQGRGVKFQESFALAPHEYRDALRFMLSTGRPLVISDPIFATLADRGYYRQGCTCGTSSIRVEADGTITPCTFTAAYHIGNVRTDSLVDIWRRSPALQPVRERNAVEECSGCTAWSHCRGGCFGSAFLATGDINARDPQCWIEDKSDAAYAHPAGERITGGADMRSYVCSAYMAIRGDAARYTTG